MLLLGLFEALRYLPPMALTMLWLGFLLPKLAFTPLSPIYLSSVSPYKDTKELQRRFEGIV